MSKTSSGLMPQYNTQKGGLGINTIYQGDVLEVLKSFPDECVDTIITSPPYYGLRDYGTAKWEGGDERCDHQVGRNTRKSNEWMEKKLVEGTFGDEAIKNGELCPKCGAKRIDQQLGLEKTLDEYLNKMLLITKELHRVLKKTGTMWWDHGDCYSASRWTGNGQGQPMNKFKDGYRDINPQKGVGLDDKTLVMQNYRLAQEMVYKQGWYLRNIIIWHKPNCMPSSVKDRFTVDYEPVFFFSKSKKYWFETQYEPYLSEPDYKPFNYRVRDAEKKSDQCPQFRASDKEIKDYKATQGDGNNQPNDRSHFLTGKQLHDYYKEAGKSEYKSQGRNKRCVWKIPTAPFKAAHFATFPGKLIEPMILAGCPEFICKKCGVARKKIMKPTEEYAKLLGKSWTPDQDKSKDIRAKQGMLFTKGKRESVNADYQFAGYTSCSCPTPEYEAGIILDPFFGSGTVGVVAKKLNRNWLGIELNPEYVKMANKRINAIPERLL